MLIRPLTGSTTPFFGRLARWLGIEVHAEARNEYKSFISPVRLVAWPPFTHLGKPSHARTRLQYTREEFTEPQRENHSELINDLNDNLLTYIGRNRFPEKGGQGSLDHVRALTKVGPFTARTAVESGLVNGTCYRQDVLDSVMEEDVGGDPEVKLMGFYHYHKVLERAVEKYMKDAVEVGVVYLLGGIGDAGECVAPPPPPSGPTGSLTCTARWQVRHGLGRPRTQGGGRGRHNWRRRPPHRQRRRRRRRFGHDLGSGARPARKVRQDDRCQLWQRERERRVLGVDACVLSLRLSGCTPDTVADAGRGFCRYGCHSRGSCVSGCARIWRPWLTVRVLLAASTITGRCAALPCRHDGTSLRLTLLLALPDSIGVASLRPTFLQSFFDRFHVTLESFFTGSRAQDPTHSLTPAELERHARSVDDMYDDFKRRVCDGREISPDVIEGIAGREGAQWVEGVRAQCAQGAH